MVTVLGPDSVFTDIFSVMVGTVVKSRAKFRSNAGLTGVGGWVFVGYLIRRINIIHVDSMPHNRHSEPTPRRRLQKTRAHLKPIPI